jgi:hypothetical protein
LTNSIISFNYHNCEIIALQRAANGHSPLSQIRIMPQQRSYVLFVFTFLGKSLKTHDQNHLVINSDFNKLKQTLFNIHIISSLRFGFKTDVQNGEEN